MARGDQILRQWNLLRMLQTRGAGLALRQLADELDVTERTIQRDFEMLEELGFPIEHDEDEYGKRFWRMPHDFFKTGPLVLSLTEAVSLHLAESFFTPLNGTHFAEGLQAILDKVRSLIPSKALNYFRELDKTLYVRRCGITDYSAHADAIRDLSDAAGSELSVEITYHALWRGDGYTTLYDPYGLVYYEDDLFLVGHSHRAGAIRIFKVTRITSVVPTDAEFERPAEFSLEEYFRTSFGIFQPSGEPVDVVVKFSGPAAALVQERVWHESQRLEWLPREETHLKPEAEPEAEVGEPEALLASFTLSNLIEFKRWLKGYGDMAEIVSPDWLRDEMRGELLAAARQYER